jgi:hypothetical protein
MRRDRMVRGVARWFIVAGFFVKGRAVPYRVGGAMSTGAFFVRPCATWSLALDRAIDFERLLFRRSGSGGRYAAMAARQAADSVSFCAIMH